MRRTRMVQAVVVGLAGAASLLMVGCGKPAFPADLFTVRADGADYPLMLSQAKAPGRGGRPVTTQSGTQAAYSQSTYTAGNTQVTITRSSAAQSELPASVKLAAQVRRTDRWVQIDGATFTATDFATYGSSSNERLLILSGTVHK